MSQWQFRVTESILSQRYGITFVGARRNGRGVWLSGDELPQHVCDFFLLTKRENGRWYYADLEIHSTKSFIEQVTSAGTEIRWQKRNAGASGLVNIPDPPKAAAGGTVSPTSQAVSELVRTQNDGRNLNCWPVLSFGWKDADLEPGGCTGIKAITQRGAMLLVEVGGHKTFCYSTATERDDDYSREWEYLCNACTGFGCDGDSEGFTASFCDVIPVRIRSGVPPEKLAHAVVRASERRCDEFEEEMALIEKGLVDLQSEDRE
jgi:hypothetical protein